LVRQRPDTRDRRKVLVEATDKTHDLILETYAPTARAGLELLASYSLDELATIRHFLEEVLALQQRMTAVLLERGGQSISRLLKKSPLLSNVILALIQGSQPLDPV
jgi:hypothetical protein